MPSDRAGVARQEEARSGGDRSASPVSPACRLPNPATPFIGREREVGAAIGLLSGGAHLLTLTGPGGVGKTRLAIQVATRLQSSYRDGVCFVALAAVNDPGLVLPTIAGALGVAEGSGRSYFDGLAAYLERRQLLLVLDNFEQVVAAATHLAELPAHAPELQILVTSRAVLHLYGEQEYPVPPMELPSTGGAALPATQSEAVRLFIERAREARPDFTLTEANAPTVAEICRRLDGLPLAIELAAARIKLLPPQPLLNRLDRRLPLLTGGAKDRPARHQTLRDAIAWSYDLLDGEEQRLFRNLSVFAGGCTLEAAEAVLSTERLARTEDERPPAAEHSVLGTRYSILEKLGSLVDKSLLKQGEGVDGESRFFMLETIREYALERLDESSEEATLREAHARFYLALAERAESELVGVRQGAWLALLAQEHDNLRAVLRWLEATGDAESGLRLSGALWRFWYIRGHLSEGHNWLESALARGERAAPAMRMKALNGAGNLADLRGDYEAARRFHSESLALAREQGEKESIARALGNLGNVARLQGSYEEARTLHEESLSLYRELGQKWGTAIELLNLSVVLWEQGEDYEWVHRLCEEGLALQQELGDRRAKASLLSSLGVLAHVRNDYSQAHTILGESLALWRQLGDKAGTSRALSALGELAADEGDYHAAHTLQAESLTLRREVGNKRGIAECLQGLATAARGQGPPTRMISLLAAADALRKALQAHSGRLDRTRFERHLALGRDQLDPEAFEAAWAAGLALSVEDAIALALHEPPLQAPATPAPSTRTGLLYPDDLTAREVEVLRLVASGLSNNEIARLLSITTNTVQAHLRSIFAKIGVTSRSAATRYAFEQGLGG